MRTTKTAFYNAIMTVHPAGAPSMKEARRDLDRAFYAQRIGSLAM